jgi:serine/threonine protein kinase
MHRPLLPRYVPAASRGRGVSVSTLHFVGPYEVLSLIGAGGMGEVYKAHDPRLNRTVAIKILPESFARDARRLHRFEQEAQTLAALNHPNIVAVYDVGTHKGKPYLVTEFLTGETLRERLNNGPIPVRKAISYATEIAEGLSAAHSKGIIHRDLKPENIFISAASRTKVLDFGLARVTAGLPQSGDDSATLATTPQTEPGVVMGTAGYMSPEQVRGSPVDHRSDIFSFGAVLYEMITGKRAFHRASSVETMNAILKEEPPEILPERPDIPPAVERVLRHCLEKEPGQRFESARDLAFDLASLSSVSDTQGRQGASASRFNLRKAAALSAVGIAVLVGAFFLGRYLRRPTETRFHRLTFQRGYVYAARFSPDRKTVLYSASWSGSPPELFSTVPGSNDSRALGIQDAQLLAVSSKGELAVLLRPTLNQAGFLQVGTLARVSLSAGTTPREISDSIDAADWSPDGSDVAVLRLDRKTNTDILEYPVGKEIYHSTRPDWLSHVRISPDGKLIALLQHNGANDDRGRILVFDATGAQRYKSDTWAGIAGLAWVSGHKLRFAATLPEFTARQLFEADLNGEQRLVMEVPGELTVQDIAGDRTLLTINDRRIMIQTLSEGKWRDLSWLDRSIFDAISADGMKILFHEGGQGSGALGATYLRGMDGSPPVRLSDGYGIDLSPDQKWALVWVPYVPPQYRLVPTGVGEPVPITTPQISQAFPFGFVRNGAGLMWMGTTAGNLRQIFTTALDGSKPRMVAPPGVVSVVVSRNGKYVIYSTPEYGLQLWDMAENSHTTIQHIEPGDTLLALSDDGRRVWLSRRTGTTSLDVLRVDLPSGGSEVVAQIPLYDLTGVVSLQRMALAPDGKTIVISYVRHISELYLMQASQQ